MFASKITKEVTFPDGSVVIRLLSADQLDTVVEARQVALAKMQQRMGAEVLRSLREMATSVEGQAKAEVSPELARIKRYASYDRATTLRLGIVSWTYDVPIEEGVKDLTEARAKALFEAIVDLADPPKEAAEQAEKND